MLPASLSHQIRLVRGALSLQITHADQPLDSLLDIAERRNPKRAFLFVSKVLGRHIPVTPAAMREAFTALADRVPDNLPGPVLVVGMAETATGLGAGVQQVLSRKRHDTLYLSTTRHSLGLPLLTVFREEHSHAADHLIHRPVDEAICQQLLQAQSLVLVDDEASTGNTFINLVQALRAAGLSQLQRIVTATLVDWSGDAVRTALGETATAVSLLSGRWRWEPDPDAPAPEMPCVDTVARGDWTPDLSRDWGRLGVQTTPSAGIPKAGAVPGEKILVLGSSEFVWPPFLLAEQLAAQGADVRFGSTSRSPIATGLAIRHAFAFTDNYGLGIANFLYNVCPEDYDRVLLCVETAPDLVDPHLRQLIPNLEILTYAE